MKVLITYASKHGATRGIADRVAQTIAHAVWLFSSGPVGAKALPEPEEITEFREIASCRGHHTFLGSLEMVQ